MRVAITGADGRIGRVLTRHWRNHHNVIAIGQAFDLTVRGPWEMHMADADTVVHLAARLEEVTDFEVLQANVEMTLNVVRAAHNAERLVFASSLWAVREQTSLEAFGGTYYSASKLAGEAIVKGWSDIHRRPAVSLRIGKFGSPAPVEHELLRVDEAALEYWFDKAVAHQEPTHCCWLAFGRLNEPSAGPSRGG